MRAADPRALPLLRSIKVLNLYRVELAWVGGPKVEIDLAPHILRYAIYRPLRDNLEAFRKVKVIDHGVAVAWPEYGLDISADAISALYLSQVLIPGEFGVRLKKLGLSFDAAAAMFEISRRQIAYYAAGEKPIPRHIVLALRGLEAEMGGV
jgi:hypothetical protein